MEIDWISLLLGWSVGILTSWFFYQLPKEEKWDDNFSNDKQRLNRFLEQVAFELDLLIENLQDYEEIDDEKIALKFDTLPYFRRLLNKDPFTLSFGDSNFESKALEPIRNARDLIDQLKTYTKVRNFDKNTLQKYRSNIYKLRIKILSIKV